MVRCNYCGTIILWGGEREGALRFCDVQCKNTGLNGERKKTNNERKPIEAWVLVIFVALVLSYVGAMRLSVWLFPESEWATKWSYSLEEDLKGAQYVVNTSPHDCEFFSAPLGGKHCHYEKEVLTTRVRNGQSGREVSYDEGTTWKRAGESDKPSVFVFWKKVED